MNEFINYYTANRNKIIDVFPNLFLPYCNYDNNTMKENLSKLKELFEKGKMIRGTLVTLGYHMNNEDINYSIPLAAAYELFETAILVHDDIIDNDLIRRGIDNISGYNIKKYQEYSNNKDVANSIGICFGDYGFYVVHDIILHNYIDNKRFLKINEVFNNTALETIYGEVLDVVSSYEEKNKINKEEDIEKTILEIYRTKTSLYTIVSPLKLGMLLGGSTDNQIKDIEEFALPLGIAFQIQDDIIGIYEDLEKIGKPVGGDIKEFKQTILYSYTKNTDYYNELLEQYGKDNYDLNKVREIFDKSGAKEYSINYMNNLYDQSLNKLNQISWLSPKDRKILIDLVDYLKNRKK